jgi:thymidylate synthase
MPMFESESADGVWLLAVEELKKRAALPLQEGRGGSTCEMLHAVLQVSNPRERWVVSRSPGLSVAFAIVEVIGILNGRRDSGYLNFFNPRLPKFAGNGPLYHGAYGFRLRENGGFDQLDRAYQALRSNPDGRQVVLQIWDTSKDFPTPNGAPVAPDIPCNVCSMLKIRDDRLEWVQVMRSNDLFKGLPYNLVQFTALQEVMAGWIGVELGSYTHFSDSLHIYDNEIDLAFGSSRRPAPPNGDSLALPKDAADPIWAEMNRRVDKLVAGGLADEEFSRMVNLDGAPQAFTNLMSIVVADAARRRGRIDAAQNAADCCTNPLLKMLWGRWVEWKKSPRPEMVPKIQLHSTTA